jgi:hypothetical protein
MTKKEKKPYSPPRLTNYGNIAKLTQGGGSINKEDGKSGMEMAKAQ